MKTLKNITMTKLKELFATMQKDVAESHHLSDGYLDDLEKIINENKNTLVTRLEVIDQTGRVLVLNSVESIGLSLQDEDRTLKIFLENNNPKRRCPVCDNFEDYGECQNLDCVRTQ